MSDEQIGERRRRREGERAAQAAAGPEGERTLTRREIRAREAALQTGELKIDDTGNLQVIKEPEKLPEPDPDGPATGAIGLTRRQLRELRQQDAGQTAASTPPEPAGGADSGPAEPPSQVSKASTEPTPARGVDAAPPPPPVRRPVVRPPASAAGVRGLTEDGTGLAPVGPRVPEPTDPSSPTEWTATSTASVDVTGSLPPIDAPSTSIPTTATRDEGSMLVRDPGPLPTTRRTRRVVGATMQVAAAAEAPSIDALIAGENDEPEPFDGTPSWVEMPPTTPASPMPAVALSAAEAVPDGVPHTEVFRPNDGDTAAAGDDGAEYDDEVDDDDHRTPGWLTALMVLVLVVIAIVLGLLVWRMVQGEGSVAAAVFWQGGTVTQETMA